MDRANDDVVGSLSCCACECLGNTGDAVATTGDGIDAAYVIGGECGFSPLVSTISFFAGY